MTKGSPLPFPVFLKNSKTKRILVECARVRFELCLTDSPTRGKKRNNFSINQSITIRIPIRTRRRGLRSEISNRVKFCFKKYFFEDFSPGLVNGRSTERLQARISTRIRRLFRPELLAFSIFKYTDYALIFLFVLLRFCRRNIVIFAVTIHGCGNFDDPHHGAVTITKYPKCSVSTNAKPSCCTSDGAWRGQCDNDDANKAHAWDEGFNAHVRTQFSA